MDTPEFWIAAVASAVFVGVGKGGIPLIGMLGVPIFALVTSPVVAAGILLPVYVVSDLFGLWAYRRAFSPLILKIMVPPAVLGIGLGWLTAHVVPEAAVTLLIGVIGIAFAASLLPQRGGMVEPRPARLGAGWFWGVITGFTSFVSHSGGPPYQVYTLPLKMEKAEYAGTSTIFFAIVNAVKLLPYWALGQFSAENLTVSAWLALPAAAAVFLGVFLVRRMSQRVFYALITWSLLLVSLKLVRDGLAGLGLI